jgi:hypothetical protein
VPQASQPPEICTLSPGFGSGKKGTEVRWTYSFHAEVERRDAYEEAPEHVDDIGVRHEGRRRTQALAEGPERQPNPSQ